MTEGTPRRPLPEIHYRIVCYEIEGDQQTIILDATARGFIAVTGTINEDGTMHGEGTHAGPLHLTPSITPASALASGTHLLRR
jgi:hypothetical protein